jgi:hypothetical protein
MFRPIALACSLLALAACASPQAAKAPPLALDAFIKVAESPCYFRCTQFEVVVRPDGGYALDNIANTRKDGKSVGRFGPDVWAKAVAAFAEAKFDTQTNVLEMEPGGTPCINDAPFISITRHFYPGDEKKVQWYLGCPSKPLSDLTVKLNALFEYKTLTMPDN